MITITREFTKEQLIEHIKGRKEFADECAADSTLHPERREYYELTAEALRIALASLEAEPVAYMWDSDRKDVDAAGYYRPEHKIFAESSVKRYGGKVVALYAAPPAPMEAEPVAVTDDMAYAFHHALSDSSLGADEVEEIKAGLRAAFANVTTPTAPVFPCDLEEIIFTIVNAMADEKLRNDESELFSLARKYIEHAKSKLSAAMLQGADGNSPVIPDCWVMVPKEATPDMINSAMRDNETGGVAEIYELMIAAAPQLEAQ